MGNFVLQVLMCMMSDWMVVMEAKLIMRRHDWVLAMVAVRVAPVMVVSWAIVVVFAQELDHVGLICIYRVWADLFSGEVLGDCDVIFLLVHRVDQVLG